LCKKENKFFTREREREEKEEKCEDGQNYEREERRSVSEKWVITSGKRRSKKYQSVAQIFEADKKRDLQTISIYVYSLYLIF